MSKKDEGQIDTNPKKEKEEKKKEDQMKDDKGRPLTESDVQMIKRYGKGPYNEKIKNVEDEIKKMNDTVSALCGFKESDTGLSLPAQWNLEADAMLQK